jgi:hypothetical protein
MGDLGSNAMNSPRPSVATFARSVVEIELAADAGDALGVADRIAAKLLAALGRLVGTAGFDALLSRAVVLARSACPGLAGVRAVAGGRIEGFRESLIDQDTVMITTAAEALLAHFIELLVVLIGEDLGMRLVRAAWPSLSAGTLARKGNA